MVRSVYQCLAVWLNEDNLAVIYDRGGTNENVVWVACRIGNERAVFVPRCWGAEVIAALEPKLYTLLGAQVLEKLAKRVIAEDGERPVGMMVKEPQCMLSNVHQSIR